jgi:hypothetical protein
LLQIIKHYRPQQRVSRFSSLMPEASTDEHLDQICGKVAQRLADFTVELTTLLRHELSVAQADMQLEA